MNTFNSKKSGIYTNLIKSGAQLTLDASNDVQINADGGNIIMTDGTNTRFDFDVDKSMLYIKEITTISGSERDGFGQLWVKTAVPNELYFTNDVGNDIQLTSGSSPAGGEEEVHKVSKVSKEQ